MVPSCLGGCVIHWTKADVVSTVSLGHLRLLRVVRRNSNDPLWAEHFPGSGERQIVLTDMNTVGIDSKCDVCAIIDNKQTPGTRANLLHFMCDVEKIA